MSLSASGGETKTMLVETAEVSNGTDTMEIDAPEDREILGYRAAPHGFDVSLDSEGWVRAYTGREPFPGKGSISDNEQFAVHVGYENQWDATNGLAGNYIDESGYVDLSDNPIPWEKHVTLTVMVNETMGNDTVHGHLELLYREV